MIEVPLVRLDRGLPLPTYARTGDAAVDLLAAEDVLLVAGGGRAIVPTGVAVAIPTGWAGLVLPRSGLAARHGVTLVNTPGLIDAGYRGELQVVLLNTDPSADYQVHRGDRVAQLLVQRVEQVAFREVDSLPDSERGSGGFGHTGR